MEAVNTGYNTLAVTSMHICARIFAWAWDFIAGSTAYPMQHVSIVARSFSFFKIKIVDFKSGCLRETLLSGCREDKRILV